MAEPASDVNRRTSVLFCKSKSVSPPKSAKNTETQPTSPQLGTKTFLSVVLPRLETLLQPRKRSRSTCGDSEVEEGSPGKRLDTGKCHGTPRSLFQGCWWSRRAVPPAAAVHGGPSRGRGGLPVEVAPSRGDGGPVGLCRARRVSQDIHRGLSGAAAPLWAVIRGRCDVPSPSCGAVAVCSGVTS